MDDDLAIQLFGPFVDPFKDSPRYQRVKSALTLIGFKKSKLYALIRQGRIRAVKLDGATFVDMASVAALFAACPEIAPERHTNITAEQLGLTVANLPAEDTPESGSLSSIRLGDGDLAWMQE